MQDIQLIEEYYKKISKNLHEHLPEAIFTINIDLLHHFDLLHFTPLAESKKSSPIPHSYQVVEAAEKITLIDERFIIWILSQEQNSVTYTIIALNRGDEEPKLEAAFVASGVYNNSNLVLEVLEKFLLEIEDTEKLLTELKRFR
jgi:hypothetical protein